MDVFGLEPIQATIIVTIIGVGLQVGLGYLKSGNPFDGRQLLTSAIIVLVVSFTIVGVALLVLVLTQILQGLGYLQDLETDSHVLKWIGHRLLASSLCLKCLQKS